MNPKFEPKAELQYLESYNSAIVLKLWDSVLVPFLKLLHSFEMPINPIIDAEEGRDFAGEVSKIESQIAPNQLALLILCTPN